MPQQTKVVLITGGARGIGRGITEYLLHRGWRVAICDVDLPAAADLVEQYPTDDLLLVEADVAVEADVKRALDKAVNWGGQLDAVVNNAGLADPDSGPLETLDLKVWQRRLDVNLTGPMLMAKHAAGHLKRSGGSIVNIASTRAKQSEPDTEAYAASKGGLLALTHALAISLGPDVRVNSVSPGWIDVRGLQPEADAEPEPLSETDHRQHPAGRVGRAEDVAAAVSYLISEEAGFVTGQDLVVDGGMTRKMIYQD